MLFTLAFAFFAGGQSVSRAAPAPSPDDAYLDELKGDWDMSGTLLGKPVRYQARGERVLQGGFLRLHMVDASGVPPTRPTSLLVSTLAQATTWRTGSIDSAPPEREWWPRARAKDRGW